MGKASLYSSSDLGQWTPIYSFIKGAPTTLIPVTASGRQRFFHIGFNNYLVPTNFVWIQPGEFIMGSPEYQVGRSPDEGPERSVRIMRGFWMGQFEVTAQEWGEIMESNPSSLASSPRHPVENVSWSEAIEFCRMRTLRDRAKGLIPPGASYRLPSEAEWEYACRAGTTTRFSFGDDLYDTEALDYGWRWTNSKGTTHPVGQKLPNAWGLFDMHGNVFEWCLDLYGPYPGGEGNTSAELGGFPVFRGGAWLCPPAPLRSASRHPGSQPRAPYIGFRMVLGADTDTVLR